MAHAIRPAARALIVDSAQRLLLFRGELPDRGRWWFAPGGALEPGETYERALVREVLEETGIAVDIARVGAPVWTRDVLFTWQGAVERHREQFFLVRIDEAGASIVSVSLDGSGVFSYRWWTIDDIRRSSECFSPSRMGELLAPLLRGDMPDEPLEVGG